MSLDAMVYTDPVSGNINVATDKRSGKHYQTTSPSQIMPSSGLALSSVLFDFNPATAGDNEIVALSGSTVITVYGWELNSFDDASIKFNSNTTQKWPLMPFAAGEKHHAPQQADPLFTCTAGHALNLNSSTTGRKTGIVWYTQG